MPNETLDDKHIGDMFNEEKYESHGSDEDRNQPRTLYTGSDNMPVPNIGYFVTRGDTVDTHNYAPSSTSKFKLLKRDATAKDREHMPSDRVIGFYPNNSVMN